MHTAADFCTLAKGMTLKSNKFKTEAEEPEPVQAKRRKKEPVGDTNSHPWYVRLVPGFLFSERFVRVSGLFLLLFSLFLITAFVSHLFYWKNDYDILKDADTWQFISEPGLKVMNTMGKFGALMAFVFFHNWFGISAFLIPFFLVLLSLRMFFGVTILPFAKTFSYSLFSLIFISLTLAFVLKDEFLMYSGGFGFHLYSYLVSVTGKAGVGLILLFSGLSFGILAFNWKLSIPAFERNSAQSPEVVAAESNQVRMAPLPEVLLPDDIDDPEEETDHSIRENIPLILQEIPDPEPMIAGIELTIEESEPDLMSSVEDIPEGLTDEDLERMNLKEVLSENEEFELGEYDPTLDLSSYQHPGLDLLDNHGGNKARVEKAELEANSNRIIETLKNYNIEIARISASIGPTVTLYEIVPAAGVRISKIKNLEDDIALSLSALGIRIIAPMPGKGTIGIEVPNQNPEVVAMKTLLGSEKFTNASMDLPIALGKTISNENFVADLAKMPHLLMAGATGQGKSVGLNAILVSLLYKKHPSQIKFVLVDPKKVELTLFNKIERHFLAKLPNNEDAIITDTKKVVTTLNSLCVLMDQRYELLKIAMVRNIKEYNVKFLSRKLNPKKGHHFMPYIVLVVDEFADLIMTAGKEVELPIARLAQLARAIGIHLIIATQRPSVNIITGTIKANFPARIAFRVTSKIDSRTILDSGGAEQLIGRGDMLLSTGSDLIRLQCPFVDTPEVDRITEFIGQQRGYASAFELPEYIDENAEMDEDFDDGDRDSMFSEAAHIVVMHQQGSASLLQRKLKLGYNRAGRIIDQLEKSGIIGPFEGSKARKVLIKDALSLEQFLNPAKSD
jgi:DNA segregation ATPase FtsK/SpoIIIE, S-DNA-T family